jgi:hypothetical protein
MRDLSDMTRFLRKPQNLVVTIIGIVVVIFLISAIIGSLSKKANQSPGPPTAGKTGLESSVGPPPIQPPVQPTKKGLAILYDVSRSMPNLLENQFDSAIQDANTAVGRICSNESLDPSRWEIERESHPEGIFDVIVLIRMGEPSTSQPFFTSETIELQNLESNLPSPRCSEFSAPFTYITLARAVGAEALEGKADEIYLLLVSDRQESKSQFPITDEWAKFSASFEADYNRSNRMILAYWKQRPDLWLELIKLERG